LQDKTHTVGEIKKGRIIWRKGKSEILFVI